jgi:hypothetical protein
MRIHSTLVIPNLGGRLHNKDRACMLQMAQKSLELGLRCVDAKVYCSKSRQGKFSLRRRILYYLTSLLKIKSLCQSQHPRHLF